MKFEILDNGLVLIQEENNGLFKEKTINYSDFFKIMQSLYENSIKDKKNESLKGYLYCENNNNSIIQTIMTDKKNSSVIIKRKKSKAPFIINNKTMEIEYPNLIFVVNIANGSFSTLKVMATKEDIIDYNTELYYYPFTNVYADSRVCLGGNRLRISHYETNKILEIPNLFFSMANTGQSHKKTNSKNFDTNELISYILENGFNDELLVSQNKNYRDLLEEL